MKNKSKIYHVNDLDIEVVECRKTNFTRPSNLFKDAKFDLASILPHKGDKLSSRRDFCEAMLDVMLIDLFEDFVLKRNKLVVNKVEIGLGVKSGKHMICINDNTVKKSNILFYPNKVIKNIIDKRVKGGYIK